MNSILARAYLPDSFFVTSTSSNEGVAVLNGVGSCFDSHRTVFLADGTQSDVQLVPPYRPGTTTSVDWDATYWGRTVSREIENSMTMSDMLHALVAPHGQYQGQRRGQTYFHPDRIALMRATAAVRGDDQVQDIIPNQWIPLIVERRGEFSFAAFRRSVDTDTMIPGDIALLIPHDWQADENLIAVWLHSQVVGWLGMWPKFVDWWPVFQNRLGQSGFISSGSTFCKSSDKYVIGCGVEVRGSLVVLTPVIHLAGMSDMIHLGEKVFSPGVVSDYWLTGPPHCRTLEEFGAGVESITKQLRHFCDRWCTPTDLLHALPPQRIATDPIDCLSQLWENNAVVTMNVDSLKFRLAVGLSYLSNWMLEPAMSNRYREVALSTACAADYEADSVASELNRTE